MAQDSAANVEIYGTEAANAMAVAMVPEQLVPQVIELTNQILMEAGGGEGYEQ